MKKRVWITTGLLLVLLAGLFILNQNPMVICRLDVPANYIEAAREQAKGLYSVKVPLVPVGVRIDRYSAPALYYTIYYFPVGSVKMSYTGGEGYNIERPLTRL